MHDRVTGAIKYQQSYKFILGVSAKLAGISQVLVPCRIRHSGAYTPSLTGLLDIEATAFPADGIPILIPERVLHRFTLDQSTHLLLRMGFTQPIATHINATLQLNTSITALD